MLCNPVIHKILSYPEFRIIKIICFNGQKKLNSGSDPMLKGQEIFISLTL